MESTGKIKNNSDHNKVQQALSVSKDTIDRIKKQLQNGIKFDTYMYDIYIYISNKGLISRMYKEQLWSWRDDSDSAVKDVSCSSKGYELEFQHPYQADHNYL